MRWEEWMGNHIYHLFSVSQSVVYICYCCCSVAQLCLTLCNPKDYSLPGSYVHGIPQARILEWVAFPPAGELPDPGIEPISLALLLDPLPPNHLESPLYT